MGEREVMSHLSESPVVRSYVFNVPVYFSIIFGGVVVSGGIALKDKTSLDSCPKYHSPRNDLMKLSVLLISSFFS